ncbi:hypothetical protein BGZ67_007843 [Mortierella alpina]|nr:hypothetical protein BGZ67_007843 [Mortierella alpina]
MTTTTHRTGSGGRRLLRTCLFATLAIVLYSDILHSFPGSTAFGGILSTVSSSFASSHSSSFFVQAAAETTPNLQRREAFPTGESVAEEDLNPSMDGVSDPEWVRPYHDGPGYFHNTEQEQITLGADEDVNSPVPSPHKPKGNGKEPAVSTDPKKFLLVDFNMAKGIGEVRAAIEGAVYFAYLTKRTLVLPPLIYFRGCKNAMLCKISAKEEDLFTHDEGEGIIRRPRWAVPFERIYDVEKMRKHIGAVLMDDWVKMMIEREQKAGEGEDPKPITSGLQWLKDNRQFQYSAAHNDDLLKQFKDVSLHEQNIQTFLYQPQGTILESRVGFDESKPAKVYGYPDTFNRNYNMTWNWDFGPSQTKFIGIAEHFATIDQEVLYFSGGITKWNKVLTNFGSEAGRDAYEDVAAKWVQFSTEIRTAADYLVRNLLKYTGGRSYVAVHYRRGPEFLHAQIPHATGNLANYRLGLGTKDIRSPLLRINSLMMKDHSANTFPLQDLDEWTEGVDLPKTDREAQNTQTQLIQRMLDATPRYQTPMDHATRERYYFMATDEKDLGILETMHEQGALLMGDLLDDHFVQQHMEWMGFQDWYGYVEQLICVKARTFLGSPMSVFSGTIMNQRIQNNRYGRLGNGWLYRPVRA